MNESLFKHQLKRGLGSVILAIQSASAPEAEVYQTIVKNCCLKSLSYDPQCEGTKGKYLYQALKTLGATQTFEATIISAFHKRTPVNLFDQLMDILLCYVEDGSSLALQAITDKYQVLLTRLQNQQRFSRRYCEREQLETLMISLVDAHGWKGFKQCVFDMGHTILTRGNDNSLFFHWFLICCQQQFGQKRTAVFLQKQAALSPEGTAFCKAAAKFIHSDENEDQAKSAPPAEKENDETSSHSSLEHFFKAVDSEINKPLPPHILFSSFHATARKFALKADETQLNHLATAAIDENNLTKKRYYLDVFRTKNFPLDPAPLLPLIYSENATLAQTAINVLARLKHPAIHDIAVSLILKDNLEDALPLLIQNWRKKDDLLIQQALLKSKAVSHSVQMSIKKIYQKHRSSSCKAILLHVYRNGKCSFCRSSIVESMGKNKVLSDSILAECLYDSYEDTRIFANKVLKQRTALLS